SEKAEDLYREAARNTLRHVDRVPSLGLGVAGEDEALPNLLLHLDNNFQNAERLIVQMLEKRDQWLRHTGVSPDFSSVRTALEDSLQKLILAELARLHEAFDQETAREIALVRGMDCFPDARLEHLGEWKRIAD